MFSYPLQGWDLALEHLHTHTHCVALVSLAGAFQLLPFSKTRSIESVIWPGGKLQAMTINNEDLLMLAKSISPLENRESKLLKVSITHGGKKIREKLLLEVLV